jgi:hypothetical protein
VRGRRRGGNARRGKIRISNPIFQGIFNRHPLSAPLPSPVHLSAVVAAAIAVEPGPPSSPSIVYADAESLPPLESLSPPPRK